MRRSAALVVAALVMSGVGVAGASAAATASCNAAANQPYKSSGNLRGSAGQSGACSTSSTYDTALRRDLSFSPDPTQATGSGRGATLAQMQSATCVSGNYYYTQSSTSSGGYAESGRTSPC